MNRMIKRIGTWRISAIILLFTSTIIMTGCADSNPWAQGFKDLYQSLRPRQAESVMPDSVSGLYSTQTAKNQYLYLSLQHGSYTATLYASNGKTQVDKEVGTYLTDEDTGTIVLTEAKEPSYKITHTTADEEEPEDTSLLTSHIFYYDAEAPTVAEIIDENGMVLTVS